MRPRSRTRKADIELRVTAGMEGQRQADEEIAKLELSRVPRRLKIRSRPPMAATAVNPQQVQAAEDYRATRQRDSGQCDGRGETNAAVRQASREGRRV